MNDAACTTHVEEATQRWRWPIDRSVYDRTARLYPHETGELDRLVRRNRFGCWSQSAQENLSRLRRPVCDVLKIIEARPGNWCTTTTVLLLDMHRRQTSFWGWTDSQWIETIGTSPSAFCARHSLIDDTVRPYLAAVAYLLECFQDISALGTINHVNLARHVFGAARLNGAIGQAVEMTTAWGFGKCVAGDLRTTIGVLVLANRSPHLRDITVTFLEQQRRLATNSRRSASILNLSRVLLTLGFTGSALPFLPETDNLKPVGDIRKGVSSEWVQWVERWRTTSTLQPKTRRTCCAHLFKAGRWLAKVHPECSSPEAWTREIAADWVAAVCRMGIGDWVQADPKYQGQRIGKPLGASTRGNHLSSLSAFFRDCQEWEWIPRRFDARRCFAIPRSIRALLAPNPRIIADDVWAKLLWAGLNLAASDLPVKPRQKCHYYSVEMVKAVTIVWLFCGLRMDEIRRLQVGCVMSSKAPDGPVAVCMVAVPANKTTPAFTKPVDQLVGEAVRTWEAVRPLQPLALDEKTGELVDFLFMFRGRKIAERYINATLIPILCQKAGIPNADATGNITSHRARSTIASQLLNSKEPMSLFELQKWLGHKWAYSTEYYLKTSATKLAESYRNAETSRATSGRLRS